MSNLRARSLRRMREREVVATLIDLSNVAHQALHTHLRVAETSQRADLRAECLAMARELGEAIPAECLLLTNG